MRRGPCTAGASRNRGTRGPPPRTAPNAPRRAPGRVIPETAEGRRRGRACPVPDPPMRRGPCTAGASRNRGTRGPPPRTAPNAPRRAPGRVIPETAGGRRRGRACPVPDPPMRRGRRRVAKPGDREGRPHGPLRVRRVGRPDGLSRRRRRVVVGDGLAPSRTTPMRRGSCTAGASRNRATARVAPTDRSECAASGARTGYPGDGGGSS